MLYYFNSTVQMYGGVFNNPNIFGRIFMALTFFNKWGFWRGELEKRKRKSAAGLRIFNQISIHTVIHSYLNRPARVLIFSTIHFFYQICFVVLFGDMLHNALQFCLG